MIRCDVDHGISLVRRVIDGLKSCIMIVMFTCFISEITHVGDKQVGIIWPMQFPVPAKMSGSSTCDGIRERRSLYYSDASCEHRHLLDFREHWETEPSDVLRFFVDFIPFMETGHIDFIFFLYKAERLDERKRYVNFFLHPTHPLLPFYLVLLWARFGEAHRLLLDRLRGGARTTE